jgi:CRISPR-associated endonuclease/helicase Cas3
VIARISNEEEALTALAEAADTGGAVAWVRNSVDDAIEAANLLHERGLEPILFHARFAIGDRLNREEEVLKTFGVESTAAQRRGRVLVATQVVEQSLDLDFDLMVSDLAPADLVIQRAGRLWRHKRAERPVPGPRLLLLSPEPIAEPPETWLGRSLRRTGYVYIDHALLWRSARTLLQAGAIRTPDNIRHLVETAYDKDLEPEGLARATGRAEGKRISDRGIAWQNLLQFDEPYRLEAGLWAPDVRTPTRLGDPQTTLRLALIVSGRIVPLCPDDSERRAWSFSEVSVRTTQIAEAAPDAADLMITESKKGWPKWEQETPIIVLRPISSEEFQGVGLDHKGHEIKLTYSRSKGLLFPPRRPRG